MVGAYLPLRRGPEDYVSLLYEGGRRRPGGAAPIVGQDCIVKRT